MKTNQNNKADAVDDAVNKTDQVPKEEDHGQGHKSQEAQPPKDNKTINHDYGSNDWLETCLITLIAVICAIFLFCVVKFITTKVNFTLKNKRKSSAHPKPAKENRQLESANNRIQSQLKEISGYKLQIKIKNDEILKQKQEIESMRRKIEQSEKRLRDETTELSAKIEESRVALEKTRKSLWPNILLVSDGLAPLLSLIEKDYLEQIPEAQALHASFSQLAMGIDDTKAAIRQIFPMSEAFYNWLNNRDVSDEFASILADWLTAQFKNAGIHIKPVTIGELYSDSIHSCSAVQGTKISKVESFLMLTSENKIIKKAVVKVTS